MSSPTQSNRPISITTPLGTDVLLLQNFTFREELGRPFAMHLEMQSTDADIDFEKIIGENVTVQVALPTNQPRYFNGYIATFEQTGFEGSLSNYRAVMVPWIGLLDNASDCCIFQNLTIPEILQQVFQKFGFSDVRNALTATYPALSFCVQYNETALNFVSRLMEFAGIYYYYEHTEEKDTLVLCDAGTVPGTFPGYETIPYNPEKFALHAPQHIYEWILTQEVKPATFYLDDYNYTQPKADLLEKGQVTQSYAQGQYSRFTYPGDYQTADQGQALANIRIQEQQARQMMQRGQSNALGVAAGLKFSFTNYPRQDQNVDQFTTSLVLRVTTADFSTADAGQADFSSTCDFTTIVASRVFRPARITAKPRVPGPQTATVVGASGSEVDADGYGSVIVQFHWDRVGESNQNSSCRIRVSQEWAGSSWGAMFIPHIGSEVVVSFQDGDPDRPLITGRVYNADQMPPQNPSSSPYLSYIEDSSQENLISMDATANAEKLVIQNAKNEIVMDSTAGSETLTITDGASKIVFDPNKGTVTTTTPGDQDTTNEASTHQWTWGDWQEWILGLKVTNVFGLAWNYYMGGYTKFIAPGVELGLILGGKFEVVAPFSFKLTKGWQYEKNTMTKLFQAPAKVEVTNTTTKMTNGQRLVTVTGEDLLTVNGTRTETVTGSKTEIFGAVTATVAADSVETVTGMKSITAGVFSISSESVLIDGPMIQINGDFINLG